MKILLSNDDGILAPGIAALHDAVQDLGEVTVVAPADPQSAMAHAITLHSSLVAREVQLPGFTGISVDGRPADCVRLAIRELLGSPPDLVLSGMNAGANVGINVLYSGTVAAAAEGAMMGIPSVALSASIESGNLDFAKLAAHCRRILDHLLQTGLNPGDLINVNIPSLTEGNPKGVRVVPQSAIGIEDRYICQSTEPGVGVYRVADEYDYGPNHHPQSDVVALHEGYITITPLHFDMTHHEKMQQLKSQNWSDIL